MQEEMSCGLDSFLTIADWTYTCKIMVEPTLIQITKINPKSRYECCSYFMQIFFAGRIIDFKAFLYVDIFEHFLIS